jgi:hypothetical protein
LRILGGSDADQSSDDATDSSDSESSDTDSENLGEEWSSSRENRTSLICEFNEHVGLTERTDGKKPVDFFNMLFTVELLRQLVANINRYAYNLLRESGNSARIRRWKDITIKEFKVFLGLLFHMGTYVTNDMKNYWKTDDIHGIETFKKNMSRDKFLLIMRCLNFQKEATETTNDNDNRHRMSKISFMAEYFNDIMRKTFKPDRILCIDESLVLYKGRLWIRQYLKGKKSKYGVKLYLLTDQFGLVQKVLIYGGKNDKDLGGKDHVNKVVKKLLEERLDVGHSVYMDNYYNSIGLSEYLMRRNTHSTGTLRVNRKGIPTSIKSKKLKTNEKITKYNVNGISITKWKDRREILIISSEHSGEWQNHTTRRNQVTTKPAAVLEYNKYMGGVDHHDQMMSYYNCEHKTIRWYKKLGIHFLQIMLVNSHNLYNRYGEKPLPLADYRTVIIRHLLTQHEPPITPLYIAPIHSIIKIAPNETHKTARKRCVVCYKKNKRTTVRTICGKCPNRPGLCMGRCFDEYHETIFNNY